MSPYKKNKGMKSWRQAVIRYKARNKLKYVSAFILAKSNKKIIMKVSIRISSSITRGHCIYIFSLICDPKIGTTEDVICAVEVRLVKTLIDSPNN